MQKKKVILDADPGLDDARALALLLSNNDKVDLLAVTVCRGNVNVNQGAINVLRVLKEWDRLDVPVYKGEDADFVGNKNSGTKYFGDDGLGDVFQKDTDIQHYEKYIQKEAAHDGILKLLSDHSKEVTLIAVGPLTNIAFALQKDAKFPSYLKEFFIMGGTHRCEGNATPHAEYNFLWDVHAVDLILKADIPFTLVPWELYLDFHVSFDWYDQWLSIGTKKADFLNKIGHKTRYEKCSRPFWRFCDEIAVGAFIEPSLILESFKGKCHIETAESEEKGKFMISDKNTDDCLVTLITKYDINLLTKMFEKVVK